MVLVFDWLRLNAVNSICMFKTSLFPKNVLVLDRLITHLVSTAKENTVLQVGISSGKSLTSVLFLAPSEIPSPLSRLPTPTTTTTTTAAAATTVIVADFLLGGRRSAARGNNELMGVTHKQWRSRSHYARSPGYNLPYREKKVTAISIMKAVIMTPAHAA